MGFIDMVVEKDAVKVIDFMLQDDGIIAAGGDGDVFHLGRVKGFDDDFEVAVDDTRVGIVDGKTTFAATEIAFFDRVDDDFGVDQLILGDGIFFVAVRIRDDEHFDVMANLRGG